MGGAETYIAALAPYLRRKGHEIALWHESDAPADRMAIAPDVFSKTCCLDVYGLHDWIQLLGDWRPDIIYSQGLYHPQHEEALLGIAPTVFFVHNYHATCISGRKTHHLPAMQSCSHLFGPSCIARFYPRRCGGLNPITMITDYKRTKSRLEILSRFDQVLTHSHHMEQEYVRNGIACRAIPFFVQQAAESPVAELLEPINEWRLLLMGRMTDLKGGSLLLQTLPRVAEVVKRPIRARFVGDGPAREQWERQARRIQQRHPDIKVEFTGWLSGDLLHQATAETHLHILPSLWPEPFGLSGLELGLRGIPTVAFRLGGIPDWLSDGVNGCLAECQAPLDQSLAEAIVRSLRSEDVYRKLHLGASDVALSMTINAHYQSLLQTFISVLPANRKGTRLA